MHFPSFNITRLTLAFLLVSLSSVISSASASQDNISFDHTQAFQQDFFVQSNLEFTLLHELAHAVIELNNIPVLGGEEQAADQIALMLLIMADNFEKKNGNQNALNKLLAISGQWMLLWQEEKRDNKPAYWDTHPLAIQRFYAISCLAYGSNPDKLEYLRKESMLPVERAWDCDIEFEQTRKALAWLVAKVSDYEFNESWDLVKVKNNKEQFPGRFKVVWIDPSSQEQKRIYALLKSFDHLAEVLKRINNLLNLQTDITIYMEPFCRGAGAWWDSNKNSITVCYDLIEEFEKNSLLLPNLVNQLISGDKY